MSTLYLTEKPLIRNPNSSASPISNWADVTSELVANHARCPNADVASIHGDIRDCRVDFFDFAALAQDWSDSGIGDLDGSGLVDYSDLRMLTSRWLDYNLEWAEVCLE